MKEYPKIQSLFRRDEKTHKFIEGEFSLPEFEYLQNNFWAFTEKVDGTNIRVFWDGEQIQFGGRTANAQMPIFLYDKLNELFSVDKFRAIFPETSLCLYGEGYGARIQKGGGNYIAGGVNFILFDVLIDEWWQKRVDIEDIAGNLEIATVPIVGTGTLHDAIQLIRGGLNSTFGNFMAEGLVLKPEIDLFNRMRHRVITKMKNRDF